MGNFAIRNDAGHFLTYGQNKGDLIFEKVSVNEAALFNFDEACNYADIYNGKRVFVSVMEFFD